MARVVCPICKSGFEAKIGRDDFAINCITCGVAFNAAQFLPPEESQSVGERRPGSGSKLTYDRGTDVLGGVIRPLGPPPPPLKVEPAAPDTRTGGLPFPDPETEEAPRTGSLLPSKPEAPPETVSPSPHPLAQAPADKAKDALAIDARAPKARAAQSFFEASTSTARFKAMKRTAAVVGPPSGERWPAQGDSAPSRTTGTASRISTRQMLAASPRPAAASNSPSSSPSSLAKTSDVPREPSGAPGKNGGSSGAAKPCRSSAGKQKRQPLLEGSFGPYEIEGEIARGGVGAVFRARDRNAGELVALKVLLEGEEAGEVERERFRRECETAKSLALPGMVRIQAVGEVDGKPYMAMELVEGRSLDKLIPEKVLSVNDNLVLMQAVAETVGALHEAGYVHRDLKPANILLDACGSPKVADFGLVKSLDEVTRLTASGLVCGTPAYMAPEQARGDGRNVNARSDVWALGAMLYEMLTAQAPFQADNALRLMLKITKEAPQGPRKVNPKIPRDVEWIVLKCLEKNPERRYPNAETLARDIKRFLDGEPVEARKGARVTQLVRAVQEKRRALAVAGVGVLGVVAVALLVRLFWSPQEAEPNAQRGRTALKLARLEEAEDAFRTAIRFDAGHAEAHLGLGLTLACRSIDLDRRCVVDPEAFEKALRLTAKGGELDPSRAAEAAAQAAKIHMWAKRYADEVRERERAVTLQADRPEYHQALGLAYWNLGARTRQRACLEKALRAFRTVLALRRDYPKTRAYIKALQERFLAPGSHQATSLSPQRTLSSRGR